MNNEQNHADQTGRSGSPLSLCEYDTCPQAVIVHDPVAAGAFEIMKQLDPEADLEESLLFRSRPEVALYAEQHLEFVKTLRGLVSKVFYLSEIIGRTQEFRYAGANPNQVFTRDSLITLPWIPDGYIGARMAKPLRRRETETMRAAVEALGLKEIVRLPKDLFLEGGDVIPFSRKGMRTLLVGYGPRTLLESIRFLRQSLIPDYVDEIIGIRLASWRMNLDGGLVPIAGDLIVSDTSSIVGGVLLTREREETIDVLGLFRDLGMRIIDVSPEESVFSQACNCLCVGEGKVIYYDLCRRVRFLLLDQGIDVWTIPGSELVKGRGGPRCMSRPIY